MKCFHLDCFAFDAGICENRRMRSPSTDRTFALSGWPLPNPMGGLSSPQRFANVCTKAGCSSLTSTIRTPAVSKVRTAAALSGRTGSANASMPRKDQPPPLCPVKSLKSSVQLERADEAEEATEEHRESPGGGQPSGKSNRAKPRQRLDWAEKCRNCCCTGQWWECNF